ncbi:MAG: hypothetical protein R6V86_04255 [Spirochaetia bacterium]
MEKENSKTALEQIQEASAAGFVLHESRLCAELAEEELALVGSLSGKKGTYYFDPTTMTSRYAGIMLRLEEKNYLDLAAETIRDDSKKYPRTTPLGVLREAPFSFDEESIKAILTRFNEDPQYKDLRKCTASNQAVHFYSAEHLDPGQAEYLCEYEEVGRKENQ